MVQKLTAALVLCLTPQLFGQAQPATARYDRHDISEILGFEVPASGVFPSGWSGTSDGSVVAENDVVHSGSGAVRIDRSASSSGSFSTVTGRIPIDFAGKQIELRGFLRLKDVVGFAALWMREDGDSGALELESLQRHQMVAGTHDWQEFSIKITLHPEARRLFFGALLNGSGVVWVDDLQLLVDGKPIAESPQRAPEQADEPSGVQLSGLTPLQVENLATLARVWGFLKYHHPAVTAGTRRWDDELFRVMPGILIANNRTASNQLLVKWIDSFGRINPCTDCVLLDTAGLKLKPAIGWISDEAHLGSDLSHCLQNIYRNRVRGQQYYVSIAPKVGNPIFSNESAHASFRIPEAGYQLLALFRLWNIVEYWAPNRDIVGENWDDVLTEFIPRIALAKDKESYAREMLALIADIHDTHANLWSSLNLRPPVGSCRLPVDVRFIGRSAVVTGYTSTPAGNDSGLVPGDQIAAIDAMPVPTLVSAWTPLYADSNEDARLRDMAANLTNGSCGPVSLDVRRNDAATHIAATRLEFSKAGRPASTHDSPGPTFRLLSKDVAYLKLSSVKAKDLPQYIEQAKGTRGLIVDIRNYPSEFVVFALGSLLVSESRPFVEFSVADLSNPGAFRIGDAQTLTPAEPHYDGKVVILVDEMSLSQAEYTAMALQATPHAIVLGSTTAGADGDVSEIPLPGGLRTMISGLGVFYPDGRPTQRVGVHVNVEVHPTIAGVRSGRDEVLESGIHQILPELSESELQIVTRRDRAGSQLVR